jgi:hypothetical protein
MTDFTEKTRILREVIGENESYNFKKYFCAAN